MIGTLAVGGWAVTFGTARRGSVWGEITTAGGVDDRAPKARSRVAEGVEGVRNGEGVSPSPAD